MISRLKQRLIWAGFIRQAGLRCLEAHLFDASRRFFRLLENYERQRSVTGPFMG
jgi:hypothetical protein